MEEKYERPTDLDKLIKEIEDMGLELESHGEIDPRGNGWYALFLNFGDASYLVFSRDLKCYDIKEFSPNTPIYPTVVKEEIAFDNGWGDGISFLKVHLGNNTLGTVTESNERHYVPDFSGYSVGQDVPNKEITDLFLNYIKKNRKLFKEKEK